MFFVKPYYPQKEVVSPPCYPSMSDVTAEHPASMKPSPHVCFANVHTDCATFQPLSVTFTGQNT